MPDFLEATVAVLPALIAAAIAAAVAFARERWLRKRRFLVASRCLFAAFGVAVKGAELSAERDEWDPLRQRPGRESFSADWETYKADLAEGLPWEEWLAVMRGARRYDSVVAVDASREEPPSALKDFPELEEKLVTGRHILRPYCKREPTLWRRFKASRARGPDLTRA
jgi:hypothetical protein